MSFILDALRKSEAERQRGTTPGLADARLRPRSSVRSLWLPLVVVALLANLVVLSLQWLRAPDDGTAAGTAPPPAIAPAAAEDPVSLPVASPDTPDREVRPLALESATASQRAPTGPTPAVASREPDRSASAARVADAADSPVLFADASLPTAEQLALSGVTLPRLNLELHVYSNDAAGRFVFINGSKYREAARLEEGPLVEAITVDGVVLDYNGRRFVLPRQ